MYQLRGRHFEKKMKTMHWPLEYCSQAAFCNVESCPVQISAVADIAGRVYHVQGIWDHVSLEPRLQSSPKKSQTLQIDLLAFGRS